MSGRRYSHRTTSGRTLSGSAKKQVELTAEEKSLEAITLSPTGNGGSDARTALSDLFEKLEKDDDDRRNLAKWLRATAGRSGATAESDEVNLEILQDRDSWIDLRARVGDVLMVPKLAGLAAKVLHQLLKLKPIQMSKFYEELFTTRQKDVVRILSSSSSDYEVVSAFIDSASFIISCVYKENSPIKEVPKFVWALLLDMFPTIVDARFESDQFHSGGSGPYDVLRKLCEAADDLVFCDHKYLCEIQRNEKFVNALVAMIMLGAKEFQEHEGNSCRSFLNSAVEFMSHVLLAHLRGAAKSKDAGVAAKNEQRMPEFLFGGKCQGSELCKRLLSLWSCESVDENEKNMYLDLLEMLCHVAHEVGVILVDAFYEKEKDQDKGKKRKGPLFYEEGNDGPEVCEFLASVMPRQFVFAYMFDGKHLHAKFRELMKPEAMANEPPHRVFISTTKLIVAALTSIDSESKLAEKELMKGLIEQGKNCLSQVVEGTWKQVENGGTAAVAELLNFFTCATLAHRSADLCSVDLAKLLRLVRASVREIRDSHRSNSGDADKMERFRSLALHPQRDWSEDNLGNGYYYDEDLVVWYMKLSPPAEKNKLLESVRDINVMTFKIDCLNDLLAAILSYYTARKSLIKDTENPLGKAGSEDELDSVSDTIVDLCSTSKWCAWPEQTLDMVFSLLEMSTKSTITKELERLQPVLIEYVMEYPMACVFHLLAKCLTDQATQFDLDCTLVATFLRSDRVAQFISQTKSNDAIYCLAQLYRCWVDNAADEWDAKPQVEGLIKLFTDLQPTELCGPMLDVMSIVCSHPVLLDICQKQGLFDLLSGSALSLYHKRESAVWAHVFSFLLHLPHQALIWNYLCENFELVTFFVTDKSAKDEQLARQALRTKRAVTDVLAHIAEAVPRLSLDNTFYHGFIELVVIALKSCISGRPQDIRERLMIAEDCLYVIACFLTGRRGIPVDLVVDPEELKRIIEGIESMLKSAAGIPEDDEDVQRVENINKRIKLLLKRP